MAVACSKVVGHDLVRTLLFSFAVLVFGNLYYQFFLQYHAGLKFERLNYLL